MISDRNVCDTKVVKGKFYKIIVRPVRTYGSKCWILNKNKEIKTKVEKIRMSKWIKWCDLVA